MNHGNFIFVLHSHVPYVRKSGKWPHGEEMLFEIIAETYIPLLNSLRDLHSNKKNISLSIGLTPVLLEQLNDPYMQKEFVAYIKARIKSVEKDRIELPQQFPGIESDIDFYTKWYSEILYAYEHIYNRDLIKAFRYLQDNANLDILTSAATHGYLPLLSKDSAIRGQLRTGIKHYEKYFGREPTGIWLPECGYRPTSSLDRVGIETFLEEVGLKYFFTDSHVIERGTGVIEQDLEPMCNSTCLTRLPPRTVKENKYKKDANISSTFQGYKVGTSDITVLGRDELTGMQVWSAQWGYPGDFAYREFHKKAKTSGVQYWRISDKQPGMKFKQLYEPTTALRRAEEHALHFSSIVSNHLAQYYHQNQTPGVIVSSYDTELFGHWWFEGVHWLEHVIKAFDKQSEVTLTSARDFVNQQQEVSAIDLPESSWGNGGQHSTWSNADTEHIWNDIHKAENRFESLASKYRNCSEVQEKILNQAAREVLLLQSSDWPFLVTTGQARDFAEKKFQDHLTRFNVLCRMIEDNVIEKDLIEISETDTLFKDIDFRDFI